MNKQRTIALVIFTTAATSAHAEEPFELAAGLALGRGFLSYEQNVDNRDLQGAASIFAGYQLTPELAAGLGAGIGKIFPNECAPDASCSVWSYRLGLEATYDVALDDSWRLVPGAGIGRQWYSNSFESALGNFSSSSSGFYARADLSALFQISPELAIGPAFEVQATMLDSASFDSNGVDQDRDPQRALHLWTSLSLRGAWDFGGFRDGPGQKKLPLAGPAGAAAPKNREVGNRSVAYVNVHDLAGKVSQRFFDEAKKKAGSDSKKLMAELKAIDTKALDKAIAEEVVAETKARVNDATPGKAVAVQYVYHGGPKPYSTCGTGILIKEFNIRFKAWDILADALGQLAGEPFAQRIDSIYLTACESDGELAPIRPAFKLPNLKTVYTTSDIVGLPNKDEAGTVRAGGPYPGDTEGGANKDGTPEIYVYSKDGAGKLPTPFASEGIKKDRANGKVPFGKSYDFVTGEVR